MQGLSGNAPFQLIGSQNDLKKWAADPSKATGCLNAPFTIDEEIRFAVAGAHLIDFPPKAHKLTLTATGFLSIINGATDWNTKSWYFDNLLMDLNDAALRAISTENGTAAYRSYQPHVEGCRFENCGAANSIVLNLKDVEAGFIAANCFEGAIATTQYIRFYQTGTRQIGNTHLLANELYMNTGGIAVTLDASIGGATGEIGHVFSEQNHYTGVSGQNALAVNAITDATIDVIGFKSVNDRFEGCRMFAADATGEVTHCHFDSWNGYFNSFGGAVNIIETTTKTRAFKVTNGLCTGGGSLEANSIFFYNNSAYNNADIVQLHDNEFKGVFVKTEDASKAYMGGVAGHHIAAFKNWASDGPCTDRIDV